MGQSEGVENMNRIILLNTGETIFDENFAGVDAAPLARRVPDTVALNNAVWLQDGTEDLVITANQANSSAITGASNSYSIIDCQLRDVTLDVSCQNLNTGVSVPLDIMARYINKNNYIALRVTQYLGIAFTLTITEVKAGIATIKTALSVDASLGGLPIVAQIICTPYKVAVVATVGGADYDGDYVSTNFNNSTKVGIHCGGTLMTVDSIKARKT
jgi:hypothetical protein